MNHHSSQIVSSPSGSVKSVIESGHSAWITVSPYPSKKEIITSQSKKQVFEVSLRKCGCQSVWCPRCFKTRSLKKIIQRLKLFDWRKVRHVTLTVNRDLFRDGKEAYEFVSQNKVIANMVWNLKRTIEIEVIDWVWIMEFHQDGWPHWHLFIEVSKKGKLGMIGEENIHRYWLEGSRVQEWYIQGVDHWKKLMGYFGSHGYFGEGKGHQLELPEWAKDEMKKIRRWGSMALQRVDEDEIIRTGEKREARLMRTYRVILEGCGKRSFIQVDSGLFLDGGGVTGRVEIPYYELRKKLRGEYEKGLGFVANLNYGELKTFLKSDDRLFRIWFALEDKLICSERFAVLG